MQRPQPHFYAYLDVGGFDVVVADREHVPEGAVAREIVPSTQPALLRAGVVSAMAASPAELQRKLEESGVTARAKLPSTAAARLAALMPVAIVGLGLLSLALALPSFLARGAGGRWGLRAVLVAAVTLAVVALVQRGGLGWPGRSALSAAPRLEWR